jgi:dTDP-4-amino-4,6-dideoxygalactose transaminase
MKLDNPFTPRELRAELDAALRRVLDNGQFILGAECAAFEREFAQYVGAEFTVGTGNGFDALALGLRAMGIGPGDEVIVPAATYVATWLAVSQVGARPVPVDVSSTTYNIDPARIRAALTDRTRAILPVHLYGQPADLDPILQIAAERDLWVLEDAAQAHGARYKGKHVGAHGDLAAWSFYPTKNLGAFGDAGALTTDNPQLAERLRELRNYGSTAKNVHARHGVNSRLDEVQAAVLRVKLAHLDRWNERRRALARRYTSALHDAGLVLPQVADFAEPVWHQYAVLCPQRDALRDHLSRAGVPTLIHYPLPPHLQDAYRDLGFARGAFPISERLHAEELSLPIGPHLSDAEVDSVCATIRSFR